MTIGSLLKAMERVDPKFDDGRDRYVQFDFGEGPTVLDSYRGFYEHGAIGWEQRGRRATVKEFLAMLRDALGTTRHGYKGGNYMMHDNTLLWCANYGEATSCAIVGLYDDGIFCIIHTRWLRV
jgi:hypothetical protein